MVPEAAVLVVSYDHQPTRPLRALFQMRDNVCDMLVAGKGVGIARVLVEIPLWFVKRHLRQLAGVDHLDELDAAQTPILDVLRAGLSTGGKPGEVIERLMMKLEVRHRLAAPALERILPGPCVPSPAHALETQKIANRNVLLRRQRVRRIPIGEERISVLCRLV